MCSAGDDAALPAPGFPIRESAGHRLFSASPRLIAAVHALHRLLVPRHPPRALTILTVIEPNGSVIPVVDAFAIARERCGYCAVFKDRRRRTLAACGTRPAACAASARLAPVSQSSTACRRGDATPQEGRTAPESRPGSVDVLGPTVARAARNGTLAPPGRHYGAP